MKKYFKHLWTMVIIGSLGFVVACGDDEPDIGGGGPVVADGFYIMGSAAAESAELDFAFTSASVEGEGFAPTEREGMSEAYVYLSTGSVNFVSYVNNEATTYGGSTETVPMHADSEYDMLAGELAVDGAAVNIDKAGIYHVTVDLSSSTFYVVEVVRWGAIGTATDGGWGSDQEIALTSASAEGATWTGTEITLRGPNEYKYRYNETFTIDRSEVSEGLKIFTNWGITDGSTVPGGGNIPFDEEGSYTIEINWTPGDGINFTETVTRTGDAPEVSFDPADYPWGIVGAAVDGSDWAEDFDLSYIDWTKSDDNPSGNWVGHYAMMPGDFKWRTDADWSKELHTDNSTLTGSDLFGQGDGTNYNLSTDAEALNLYFFRINTADEGASWNVEGDLLMPELIGDATPGGWDAGTATTLAIDGDTFSYTASGVALTADKSMKFRMNAGWEIQVGNEVTISGSNSGAVESGDDNNIKVLTGGTYDISLQTTDKGATWTIVID